jgi:hypothetical protein
MPSVPTDNWSTTRSAFTVFFASSLGACWRPQDVEETRSKCRKQFHEVRTPWHYVRRIDLLALSNTSRGNVREGWLSFGHYSLYPSSLASQYRLVSFFRCQMSKTSSDNPCGTPKQPKEADPQKHRRSLRAYLQAAEQFTVVFVGSSLLMGFLLMLVAALFGLGDWFFPPTIPAQFAGWAWRYACWPLLLISLLLGLWAAKRSLRRANKPSNPA